MSYAENYIDPIHEVCDHGRIDCEECWDEDREPDIGEGEDWECAYPDKCLMPDPFHHRSECYTIEDAEAYYTEMENL